MKAILALFLGAASSCLLGAEHERIRIGLYVDFQQVPPTAVREAVREELAAIMSPLGAVVEWRALAANHLGQRWSEVTTIRFRGSCNTLDLRVIRNAGWVFGQTHLVGGEVIPYIDIQCDAIRGSLAPILNSMDPRRRTLTFGRAVARVLAHELYHVLTKTSDHKSSGIAQRTYMAAELAAPEFWFQGSFIGARPQPQP